jgi:hypothetical protein
MSEWIKLQDIADIDFSDDGTEINILFETNDFGNRYIYFPVKWMEHIFGNLLELKVLKAKVEAMENKIRGIVNGKGVPANVIFAVDLVMEAGSEAEKKARGL